MALINCPECSKQVSDKALTCPNCGVGIASEAESRGTTVATIQKTSKGLELHTLMSVTVIIVGVAWMAIIISVAELC